MITLGETNYRRTVVEGVSMKNKIVRPKQIALQPNSAFKKPAGEFPAFFSMPP